jgi:hypothetical protein
MKGGLREDFVPFFCFYRSLLYATANRYIQPGYVYHLTPWCSAIDLRIKFGPLPIENRNIQ